MADRIKPHIKIIVAYLIVIGPFSSLW